MTGIRLALLLVLLALAGCGGEPMAFPVPESEMGPAPGLFTGPTGSYDVPIVKETSSAPAPGSGSGSATAETPR